MPSAARIRWAKIRVTAVTLVSLLILGSMLYALFGASLLEPKTVAYLYVPDGSGLIGGSPIRVDGIDVGKVSDVELSGSNVPARVVRVTLALRRERLVRIPADSVAQLSSDSLVGDKFVDITSGTSPRGLVPDGEVIYKDQPELLRSLDLAQFTAQLRIVDGMLADIEEGRSQFGKFYNGEEFYDSLEKKLRALHIAFQDAVSTTSMIGGLLNSDDLHKQAAEFFASLDQMVAKLQAGQGAGGKILRDPAQYNQLLGTVQGFRKSIATFGASDLMQSDATYNNVNHLIAQLIASVDEWNRNPQLNSTFLYDNLNSSVQELQKNIRDIRMNPRKYLRLKVF